MAHLETMTPRELQWILSTDIVKPLRYDIQLEPRQDSHVLGRVDIEVEVTQSTKTVTLHGLRLVIFQAFFRGQTQIGCKAMKPDRHFETLEFEFLEALPVGRGIMTVIYSASIDNTGDRNGIFMRRRFGVESLHTQCEPCNARQVFPCWDQPTAKAIFQLTMYIDPAMDCLSNSRVFSTTTLSTTSQTIFTEEQFPAIVQMNTGQERRGPQKRVIFKPTVLMSTYMLAFTVDVLDKITTNVQVPVYEDGVENSSKIQITPITVYAPPERIKESQFVLHMACFAWRFFTEKFKLNNPLEKLDIMSVDHLPVLGSENWGLICLHSNYMLLNDESAFSKVQRTARLVCHEVKFR